MGQTRKSDKGAALIVVLAVLTIMSILVGAFITISTFEQKTAINEEQNTKAYYIALSGAEILARHVILAPTKVAGLQTAGTSNKVSFGDGTFEVALSQITGGLQVKSTGSFMGKDKTVFIDLKNASASRIFKNALYSHNFLNLDAMDKVYGPLESTTDITTGSCDRGINPLPPEITDQMYPSPIFPTGLGASKGNITDAATINKSGVYTNIEPGNRLLVFDTTGGPIKIITNTFNITGEVIVTGPNPVSLFIHDALNVKTNTDVNPIDPSKLMIYLGENCTGTVSTGKANLYAYIYGPKADMIETSNATIYGGMVVQSFTGGSNANIIYVPYQGAQDLSNIIDLYEISNYH